MKGLVDSKSVKLGRRVGIDVAGGYLNSNDGRVRLFVKGKYPGAQPSGGYALRSRVVWWLNTGEVIRGLDFNVHHKNEIRHDDRFSNLEKLVMGDHMRHHHCDPESLPMCKCKHCGNPFKINRWRLKEKTRGSFCSQQCYQHHPRTDKHRAAISEGLSAAYRQGRR